ncbi:MAG: insulinase family protein, partial [Bdellovibrionaceae bacterium]|nr:insulinase family protein [Pseudobdellovibrionaceae bacterium]
ILKSSLVAGAIFFTSACVNSNVSNQKKNSKGISQAVLKQVNTPSIRLKPYKEMTLENGLKIIFVEDFSLPTMELSLLVKVGQRNETKSNLGINYFAANLLEQGTSALDANQLADELASLGTELDISTGIDFTTISIDGLTLSAEKIIDLYTEILFKPAFKEAELQKKKNQVLAQLKKIQDSPSGVANMKMNQIYFQDSVFAFPVFGNEKSIKSIKRSELIKHFLKFYRPNNSTLAVTGAISEELESKIVEVFKVWPSRQVEASTENITFQPPLKKYFVSYKKGLVQSEIRMTQPLFPRNHPDFLKMRIANEVLGGSFVSRLNSKIRDQLGLTYSISSQVDHRKDLGTLDISTFTKVDSTRKVIDQIEGELSAFITSGISAKEMASVKNLLMAQFPRVLETVNAFAFNLMYLDFNEISYSYLSDYYKNIEKITLEEVNLAIKNNLSLDKVKFFIYTDPKAKTQFGDKELVNQL